MDSLKVCMGGAKVIPPAMGPLIVKVFQPLIQVSLQGFQFLIQFFPEDYSVELLLHGPVHAFTVAVALWMTDFCFAMIHTFNLQIQIILMVFRPSIELRSPVSQYPQKRDLILIEEGQNFVVQDVGRSDGMLACVEFCKSHTAVGVYKSLLINPPNAFDGSDVISVLRAKVSRIFSFYFAMRFLLFSFAFHGDYLRFGQNQPILGNTGFQGFLNACQIPPDRAAARHSEHLLQK